MIMNKATGLVRTISLIPGQYGSIRSYGSYMYDGGSGIIAKLASDGLFKVRNPYLPTGATASAIASDV